jgi:hypothetical protein
MEIKTVIEVQGYTDQPGLFCTDAIMVSSEELDINKIEKEFLNTWGLSSTKGIDISCLNELTTEFIKFLEVKGFSKLKTKKIYFCD